MYRSIYRSSQIKTYESVLAAAGIQRTFGARDFGIFPTLGRSIAVRNTSRATVGRTIATVAAATTACAIATWVFGTARVVIPSH